MPQANSTTSMPRVSSPRASDNTFPCSLVMAMAMSSALASSSCLNLNSTRARLSGVVAAHPGKAACAEVIAASTSCFDARGTRPVTLPVAGLNTSPKRPLLPATSSPLMK